MDTMEIIEMISNKNNGIITTKAAIESGISRATLSGDVTGLTNDAQTVTRKRN